MKEDEVGVFEMAIESGDMQELKQDVKGMAGTLIRLTVLFEQFPPMLTRHSAEIQELQTHRTQCEERMNAVVQDVAAVRKEAENRVVSNRWLAVFVVGAISGLTGLVAFAIQHIK